MGTRYQYSIDDDNTLFDLINQHSSDRFRTRKTNLNDNIYSNDNMNSNDNTNMDVDLSHIHMNRYDYDKLIIDNNEYPNYDVINWFMNHKTMNVSFSFIFTLWIINILIGTLFMLNIINDINISNRLLDKIYNRFIIYYLLNLFLLPFITLFDDVKISKNYILIMDLAFITFIGSIIKLSLKNKIMPMFIFIISLYLNYFVMTLE